MKLEVTDKAKQYLGKNILKNRKINVSDTVVVAGSPRSGTTWLMGILSTAPGYTYLHEPLNPIGHPESFEVGFRSRTYLPDNVDWPEGEDYLRKTFTGHLFSFTRPFVMNFLLANKLIVKFVRLNRLLPWISKRFQLHNIFYIIRHPCAVVASQLKTGFIGYHPSHPPYVDIFPNLENILNELSEIEDIDDSLSNRLKKIRTQEEVLATVWCLDNYVPLSLPKPHPWTTVVYEELVSNGKTEIARLFSEIGEKNIPSSGIQRLERPSRLTQISELKIVKNADKQLSKWKKVLSKKQIQSILNIVSDFGLDFYTEDFEPDYNNIGVNK